MTSINWRVAVCVCNLVILTATAGVSAFAANPKSRSSRSTAKQPSIAPTHDCCGHVVNLPGTFDSAAPVEQPEQLHLPASIEAALRSVLSSQSPSVDWREYSHPEDTSAPRGEPGCSDEQRGDVDQNGVIDGRDIQPFVAGLVDPAAIDSELIVRFDIGSRLHRCLPDNVVDTADIEGFVGLLLDDDCETPAQLEALCKISRAFQCAGTILPTAASLIEPSASNHPDTGLPVAGGEPRFRKLLLLEPDAGTFVNDSSISGAALLLRPQDHSLNYQIATANPNLVGASVYYRPKDSTDKRWIPTTNNLGFLYMWAYKDCDVWLGYGGSGTDKNLWRSDDLGTTWTPVIGLSAPAGAPNFSERGYPVNWSFACAPGGRGVLVEYAAPLRPGRFLFITHDYGQNWEIAFDTVPAYNYLPKHFHAVGFHAGLDRFVADTGDLYGLDRRIYTIDHDDTPPVSTFMDLGALPQPTWFLDFGSPDEILFGSDTWYQVGIMNLVTGKSEPVYTGWPGISGQAFCFHVWSDSRLYYATAAPASNANPPYSEMIASEHPRGPWSVVRRSFAGEVDVGGSRSFAGVQNGIQSIGYVAAGQSAHLEMPVLNSKTVDALIVEPQRRNYYTATDYEPASNWYIGGATSIALAPGAGVDGGDAVRVISDGTDTPFGVTRLIANSAPLPTGRTYQISFWIKSSREIFLQAGPVADLQGRWASFYSLAADKWRRIVMNVAQLRPGEEGRPDQTRIGFRITVPQEHNVLDSPIELLFDRIMYEETPATSFVTGGTTRSATKLRLDYDVPSGWTDAFYFAPNFGTHLLYSNTDSLPTHRRLTLRHYEAPGASANLAFDWGARSSVALAGIVTASTASITLNDPVLRPDMMGCKMFVRTGNELNATGASWTIVSVVDATTCHVQYSGSFAAPSAGKEAHIVAPSFILAVKRGETEEVIRIPRQPMTEHSPIPFAVRFDDITNRFQFSVANADAFESSPSSSTAYPEFANAPLVVRCDHPDDATAQFSGAYVFCGMHETLSQEEIIELFQSIPAGFMP